MEKKVFVQGKDDDRIVSKMDRVNPATLVNVHVVDIPKEVEVPVFKDVEVHRPVYVETKFEKPVIVEKEYEKPVIVPKTIEVEKPVITEREYEKPVVVIKEYEKFVPKEVEYLQPKASMEKVNEVAIEVGGVVDKAKKALADIFNTLNLVVDTINEINKSIPDQIKVPKIITEKVTVKDVKVIEDTIHVIGKVVARDKG
jgi:hypothetical protein